jgi:uncharacterized membrane protein
MTDWSTLQWESPWPAIVAICVTSYLVRISGYWLIGRFRPGPRLTRALDVLPGSIFVASVLPIAARAGAPGLAACLAAAGLMLTTRREIFAVFGGLGAAAALRALGF